MASQDVKVLAVVLLAVVLYELFTGTRNPVWGTGEEEDDGDVIGWGCAH